MQKGAITIPSPVIVFPFHIHGHYIVWIGPYPCTVYIIVLSSNPVPLTCKNYNRYGNRSFWWRSCVFALLFLFFVGVWDFVIWLSHISSFSWSEVWISTINNIIPISTCRGTLSLFGVSLSNRHLVRLSHFCFPEFSPPFYAILTWYLVYELILS